VEEEPGILDVAHVVGGAQQLGEAGVVAVEQARDQLFLGG
jgi:hypothetical protein